MNSLWTFLVSISVLGLCTALPISLPRESSAPQWLIGSMFLLGAALVTIGGCLCCKRKKGFKEFNNEAASHAVSAESPFPIFRPLSQQQTLQQSTQQYDTNEDRSEATPLKHPESPTNSTQSHNNAVLPTGGLIHCQVPNEGLPDDVIQRNNSPERVLETPPPRTSPINNLATIRSNMQIISNAIINIVTHDQMEMDNNNGPISELDIQNIANNNAEGYIRNQNEIYEDQNVRVHQNDASNHNDIIFENRNLDQVAGCSRDINSHDVSNLAENRDLNSGVGNSGDAISSHDEVDFRPSTSTNDINTPSTSNIQNDTNLNRTFSVNLETSKKYSDIGEPSSSFFRDLSLPEIPQMRTYLDPDVTVNSNMINVEEIQCKTPIPRNDSNIEGDDVNEALRALESVLSGESDCDTLSCSSLGEVQLDFYNEENSKKVDDLLERDEESRENISRDDVCDISDTNFVEAVNSSARSIERITENDTKITCDTQNKNENESVNSNVKTEENIDQIDPRVLPIVMSIPDDLLNKQDSKENIESSSLPNIERLPDNINENNSSISRENKDNTDSGRAVSSHLPNIERLPDNINENNSLSSRENKVNTDFGRADSSHSPNNGRLPFNFDNNDPNASQENKENIDFVQINPSPNFERVPDDSCIDNSSTEGKNSSLSGFDENPSPSKKNDRTFDLIKELSSPDTDIEIDPKAIEILQTLNITTSTPTKIAEMLSPDTEVSIRKELLQKNLCFDTNNTSPKKPNYEFLKTGRINLESWDKFLGDSFERVNSDEDFEFDNLDENNEGENRTYTRENDDISNEDTSSSGGGFYLHPRRVENRISSIRNDCDSFDDKENYRQLMNDVIYLDNESDIKSRKEEADNLAEIRRALFISLPDAQGPKTKEICVGPENGTKSAQNTPDNVLVQAQKRNILGILDAASCSNFQFPDYFVNDGNTAEERNEVYIRYNAAGPLSPILEDWHGEDNEDTYQECLSNNVSDEPKVSSSESIGRTFIINENQGDSTSGAVTSDKPRQALGSWCSNDTLFNVEDALDTTVVLEYGPTDVEKIPSPVILQDHGEKKFTEMEDEMVVEDLEAEENINSTTLVEDLKSPNFCPKEFEEYVGLINDEIIEKNVKGNDLSIKIDLEKKYEEGYDKTIVLNKTFSRSEIEECEDKCDILTINDDVENDLDKTIVLERDLAENSVDKQIKIEDQNEDEEIQNLILASGLTKAKDTSLGILNDCKCNEAIIKNGKVSMEAEGNLDDTFLSENVVKNLNEEQLFGENIIDSEEDLLDTTFVLKAEMEKACPIIEKFPEICDMTPKDKATHLSLGDLNGKFTLEDDSKSKNFETTSINRDENEKNSLTACSTENLSDKENIEEKITHNNFLNNGNEKHLEIPLDKKNDEPKRDFLRISDFYEAEKRGIILENGLNESVLVKAMNVYNNALRNNLDEEDSGSEHENEDTISSNTDDYDTLTSSSQSGQEYELQQADDIIEEDEEEILEAKLCSFDLRESVLSSIMNRDDEDGNAGKEEEGESNNGFNSNGENDPWLSGIKFSDNDMMTTSFSSESPMISPDCPDVKFVTNPVEDLDDDDDTSWESEDTSGGEFEWKSGEPEQTKPTEHHDLPDIKIDHAPSEENETDMNKDEKEKEEESMKDDDERERDNDEYDEDDDSEDESEEIEFIPSTWNSLAAPKRSSLKSPENSTVEKKPRSVVFKQEKYMSVYEYPREQEHLTYIEPILDTSLRYSPNGPVMCLDRFFVTSTTLPFNEYEFYTTDSEGCSKDFDTNDQFNWLNVQSDNTENPFDSENALNSMTDFDLQGNLDMEYNNKIDEIDDQFSLDPMPPVVDNDTDKIYEFSEQNLEKFNDWQRSGGNEEITSFMSPDTPDSNNSQLNSKFNKIDLNKALSDFATPDSGIEVTPNPDNFNKSMRFSDISNVDICSDSRDNISTNPTGDRNNETKEFNNIDNLGMLCHTKRTLKLPLKTHETKDTLDSGVATLESRILVNNDTTNSTNIRSDLNDLCNKNNKLDDEEADEQTDEIVNEQANDDEIENTLNTLKQVLDSTKPIDKMHNDLLLSDVGSTNSGDEDSGIDSATNLIEMTNSS